jgi:hypothetical protein
MSSPRSTPLAGGTTSEQQFARELEVFRTEAETASQFFYCYLAVHEVAKRHKRVFRMFNEHALFWNTIIGGVQTAALIAVGRVFDQDTMSMQCLVWLSSTATSFRKQHSASENKATRENNPTGYQTTYAGPMNQRRRTFGDCESSSRNTDASTKPTTAIFATNTTHTNKPPTKQASRLSSQKRTSEKCNACSSSSCNCTKHSKSSSATGANPSSAPFGTPHNASNNDHQSTRPAMPSTNTSSNKQNKHSSASHNNGSPDESAHK